MARDLIKAFLPEDQDRVAATLDDLLPKIIGDYTFVGGLAIRYNLLREGEKIDRPFNDLDLIARGPESFNAELTEKFLVHHFHVDGPQTDFRFVFVHKSTGVKVDVFHWKPKDPRTMMVRYLSPRHGEIMVSLQSLSTQFAVTVFDLETMRQRGPVDPKQLDDAEAMEPFVMGPAANITWGQLFHGNPALTLSEALEAAEMRVASQPKSFRKEPWKSQDTSYRCAKCTYSNVFWPIAPMERVYDLLGYVEIDGENVI